MKSNPAKKTLEQCFSVKTKPTCQKSAIFEHFQKWPKNQGDVLARSPSIVEGSANSSFPVFCLMSFLSF